jgi:hypothetical protein
LAWSHLTSGMQNNANLRWAHPDDTTAPSASCSAAVIFPYSCDSMCKPFQKAQCPRLDAIATWQTVCSFSSDGSSCTMRRARVALDEPAPSLAHREDEPCSRIAKSTAGPSSVCGLRYCQQHASGRLGHLYWPKLAKVPAAERLECQRRDNQDVVLPYPSLRACLTELGLTPWSRCGAVRPRLGLRG